MYHSVNNANNPMWHWIIAARKAAAFLGLVKPYLRLKRPQAELAIKFQDAKRYGGNKSEEQLAVEEAQRLMLRNMHRGKTGSLKGLRQEMPIE